MNSIEIVRWSFGSEISSSLIRRLSAARSPGSVAVLKSAWSSASFARRNALESEWPLDELDVERLERLLALLHHHLVDRFEHRVAEEIELRADERMADDRDAIDEHAAHDHADRRAVRARCDRVRRAQDAIELRLARQRERETAAAARLVGRIGIRREPDLDPAREQEDEQAHGAPLPYATTRSRTYAMFFATKLSRGGTPGILVIAAGSPARFARRSHSWTWNVTRSGNVRIGPSSSNVHVAQCSPSPAGRTVRISASGRTTIVISGKNAYFRYMSRSAVVASFAP